LTPKFSRTVLSFCMNALLVVAVALVVRIVLRYFGVLASRTVSEVIIALSGVLVLPLGLPDVHSLYGGVFDTDAAVTLVLVLLAEWGLSVIRGDA